MLKRTWRFTVLSFVIFFLGSGTLPYASGLTITPTFDSSITNDPNAAAIEATINQAISVYEATYSNPIDVTIRFQEMNSGLGQSTWFFYNLPYSTFLNAYTANATANNNAIALAALAHLPSGPSNGITGTDFINLKTADIRALGIPGNFPSGLPGGVDGIVGLNTHITDVGSPGTTGVYSLLATAEHEINEVLGLGSSLPNNRFNSPFPEDLFRYDANGNRSYTTNSSVKSFFSIDGTTDLAQFNQGPTGDYGDWQSNPRPPGVPPQVQDAFATPFARPTLGVNELTALDAIGYNPVVAVPEPGTLSLLSVHALLLAAYGWRRRRQRIAASRDDIP